MKNVVLLLSTYPFVEPRHGGQIRLANISKAYKDSGWIVESIAVYEQDAYHSHQCGKHDVPLPQNSRYLQFNGRSVPFINDLQTGDYAVADDGGFPTISRMLPKSIDVIHVEQPWLWPLVTKIKKSRQYNNVLTVFGSQNIEAPLKQDILESYSIFDADDVIAKIESLEKIACISADLTIGVTQSDIDILTSWGCSSTLLAPNGISSMQVNDKAIERWKNKLPEEPWLLYVASAHPPNFTGFIERIGDSLGCIPPTSRLVVAGSICEPLKAKLADTKWNVLNFSRLEFVGVLSDEDLMALKSLAHGFILPIDHGGGSNIKTAEAIYSGVYVVGTKEAFRGFEEYQQLPEVTVVSSAIEFQAAIRAVLSRKPIAYAQGNHSRENLLWDRRLSNISPEIQRLLNNKKVL